MQRTLRTKQYVSVESITREDGYVRPLTVIWDDGRRFKIERVLDARHAESQRTGGAGVRYTVRIGGQVTYLFYENPRWFVEAKSAEIPWKAS